MDPATGDFTRSRRLPRVRAGLLSAATGRLQEIARGETDDRRAAQLLQRWEDSGGERAGRLSPGLRCPNPAAVAALRERKYRKEKPFALMVTDSRRSARRLVELSSEAEALLTSSARPIVLAPAKEEMAGVAPRNNELGVMLPYTPLHHLLFAAGAPECW